MMRAALLALVLAACGHPDVHFDVRVAQDMVSVSAYDVAPPAPVGLANLDECGGWSDDDPGCQGDCPGDWIAELRIEQDGAVLASGTFSATRGGGNVGTIDTTAFVHASVVIVDADGASIRIPIPSVARPVPFIDDVTVTATSPYDETTSVTWHSIPHATSADVAVSGGLSGAFCHVFSSGEATTFDGEYGSPPFWTGVTAFAPSAHSDTAFGDADVWVGTRVETTTP